MTTDPRRGFSVALSRTLHSFDDAKPNETVAAAAKSAQPAVDAKHVHIYLSQPHCREPASLAFDHEHLAAGSSLKPLTDRRSVSFHQMCPKEDVLHTDHMASTDSPVSLAPTWNRRPSLKTPPPLYGGGHLVTSISSGVVPSTRIVAKSGPAPPTCSGTAPRRKAATWSEMVACQVCDYLFMSSVEAAFNAHFLCKFNIEFLVDVTNTEPRDVPRHRKSDVPCVCARETAHSRARMTISVDTECCQDLTPYFEDVNRFIDSARACGKAVLIYSFSGKNRCAVFVAQYLMKVKGVSHDRALQFLKEKCPTVAITDNFYTSLRKWDLMLNLINASQAATLSKRTSPFIIKKSAWL